MECCIVKTNILEITASSTNAKTPFVYMTNTCLNKHSAYNVGVMANVQTGNAFAMRLYRQSNRTSVQSIKSIATNLMGS